MIVTASLCKGQGVAYGVCYIGTKVLDAVNSTPFDVCHVDIWREFWCPKFCMSINIMVDFINVET